MTLRLSDDESAALKRQADIERRSMQEVAREAVREYVNRRSLSTRVEEALDEIIPRYSDLLRRVGE